MRIISMQQVYYCTTVYGVVLFTLDSLSQTGDWSKHTITNNQCSIYYRNRIFTTIILPYSGKFSRVAIFADMGFWTISRFNFRGSALRQSHALFFHTCVEIIAGSVEHEPTMSELRSCVMEAMIKAFEVLKLEKKWRVSESPAMSVTRSCYKTWVFNNSWTHIPRKCQLHVRSFFEKEAVSFENGLLTLQIMHFLFSMPYGLYRPHPFYWYHVLVGLRMLELSQCRNGSSSHTGNFRGI